MTTISPSATRRDRVDGNSLLAAKSPGRRLSTEGVFRIGTLHAMDFVWAMFYREPFTDEWPDIRTYP
jgi:hypothetical protein